MTRHTALTLNILTVCLLSACHTLPNLDNRVPSIYIPTYSSPSLERALQLPSQALSPPNAYLHVLDNAHDAFVARATLADYASVSLDVRYYIWRNDISGGLLAKKLWQSAERGVRVRILLDDNNTRGLDPILTALNQHPNIQIRLFNPFLNRRWRALGYLADFPRVNRRMHNKSMTADNRASIIGGRNVGDEYFSSNADTAFSDMDVLLSGDVVTDVSADFDRYWRSQSAYPLESIVKKIKPQALAQAQAQLTAPITPIQQHYLDQVAQSPLAQAIAKRDVPYVHAQAQIISDDPAKALDRQHETDIQNHLDQALQTPQREIYLVSPYFVPTKTGTALLSELAKQGVDITVFTNSLKATDVSAVHSGYSRYRKPLLEAGVKLYEFKPEQAVPKQTDKGLTGSSTTSLHAKTFVVDKQRVYIGSLNMDPRSVSLNTEMGVVIHNAQLAREMQAKLQQETQKTAYRVSLDAQQKLQWRDPETNNTSHREPEASFLKRWVSKILSVLPIERLL